jgi:mannobiose 2-epimerase
VIEKYSFDPLNGGYLEAFTREWHTIEDLRLSNIDENEKKTLNTHLHLLEAYTGLLQVWPDKELKDELSALACLFTDRFISADQRNFYLFFDEQWQLKSDRISPGHDIETAWLLLETARVLEDKLLISRAEGISVKIARSIISKGTDGTGGLVYERNLQGITNYTKEWWCQVEALVGFLNAWEISGDGQFAAMVSQIWNFIARFFIDRKNGEWHFRVDRQGKPYDTLDKAGFWKCPYHTVRACLELMQRIR